MTAPREVELARTGLRKAQGAYYTPPDVVARLLDVALQPLLERRAAEGVEAVRGLRVLDPSCGSGNFLVAAAARIAATLRRLGEPDDSAARTAFGSCVVGVDIDPVALGECRAALAEGSGLAGLTTSLVEGDALMWQDGGGYDLVVGNPPFLSQLAASTSRSGSANDQLRRRFGEAVGAFTDTASLVLLVALEAARPDGGVVALIQPMSLLAARDTAGVRARLRRVAALESIWLCEEPVFDASVRVCAPVLVKGGGPRPVALLHDRAFHDAGRVPSSSLDGGTWAPLLASVRGVPERTFRTDGVLGDLAAATADFRDQYYGLRGCVHDDGDGAPLVTSGLIDPARLWWGRRVTRFDKQTFQAPRVRLDELSAPLRRWTHVRLRPKVLLAAQTRVLEPVVDIEGMLLPSVPVITVTTPDPEHLWRIGALLISAPITQIAAQRHLGSALSTDALKLSASQVLDLPLPADPRAWDQGARAFRTATAATDDREYLAALGECAALMCEAFGRPDDEVLMTWWATRLPRSGALTSPAGP